MVHADGSCIGNPGPGGWGVHIERAAADGAGRVEELGGGELHTTNNRMELRAAIEGLKATAGEGRVTLVTDSRYVHDGLSSWLAGWQRNGWRTKAGGDVANRDLWELLAELTAAREVQLRWTRGHVGEPGNERCDSIARWFSESVKPLARARARTILAERPSPSAPGVGVRYLSLVDGETRRHASWPDCAARVAGVRNARYRKARSLAEESAILSEWGVSDEDVL
ncbi:MAG: RNase H family protein [Chloroflexota bacterium]